MILSIETKADIRRLHDIWVARLAFEYRCEQTDIIAAIEPRSVVTDQHAEANSAQTVPAGLAGRPTSPAGVDAVASPATHHSDDHHDDQDDYHSPERAPEKAADAPPAGEALPASPAPMQDRPSPPSPKVDPVVSAASSSPDKTGEVVPPTSPVTSLARIRAAHEQNPTFNSRQLAEHLGLDVAKVAAAVSRAKLPIPKLSREQRAALGREAQAKHSPVPAPLPKPEPVPTAFAPVEAEAPRKIKRPSGTLFWLRHPDGRYLHRMVHTLTTNRKEAWTGTEAQLAGCRRNYEIARELREQVVERETVR